MKGKKEKPWKDEESVSEDLSFSRPDRRSGDAECEMGRLILLMDLTEEIAEGICTALWLSPKFSNLDCTIFLFLLVLFQ